MCCFFAVLVTGGPRLAAIIWWLINPAFWNLAFSSILWPILGIIFLPWTTLFYVLVSPGGVTGFEWVYVGLGVVFDVLAHAGGGYTNRERIPGYGS